MDRELLLELGTEELPASWLPELTSRLGDVVLAALATHRLLADSPVETFSTPRRLVVCVARVPERQTDLEELVNGPPVSAAFKPDGSPTPAVAGFAAKQGVEIAALERVRTPKGEYFACRKKQEGRASTDVLADVLAGTLRSLTFPKLMRWDATLDDGRGALLFGRPIRWILFLYGGRVVPFTIGRTAAARTPHVQDVTSGTVTYGHRVLTTSGRAGGAIEVRTFDDYRVRLREHFVILGRGERRDKIARELTAAARALQGRVSRVVQTDSGLLDEVPDLIEYPSVITGTFAREFLELPDEVLTTTLIHHQHYFPVESDDGALKNAFLAVVNTEPDADRTIARNAERVVAARLRDARFFWEADCRASLESRIDRLGTLTFHKKLGSYQDKAHRIERLAGWIAEQAFGVSADIATQAKRAARLAKADLTTDMVREFTELQGIIGGIYARHDGEPEEVWKAMDFHYLPVGVEADAPPTRTDLGKAAVTWAAVSLADKLDTIAGLFVAGENPTGSRDPYGLRRAAHGVFKILVDLPELTGLAVRPAVGTLLTEAIGLHGGGPVPPVLSGFMLERLRYVLEHRGFDARNVRAVTHEPSLVPLEARRKLEVLPEFTNSEDFRRLAVAFKRVRNIAKELPVDQFTRLEETGADVRDWLTDPSELALLDQIALRQPRIDAAIREGEGYRGAFSEAAGFKTFVDKFFDDVLVMDPVQDVRNARLRLLRRLEQLILELADISEIVSEDVKSG